MGIRDVLTVIIVLMMPMAAWADTGDQHTMNINISGTLMATGHCTFNVSGTVVVDFGDVIYTRVQGVNTLQGSYQQSLPSKMICNGDIDGKTQMKLDTTTGSDVSFEGAELLPVMSISGTQIDSLAIRLLNNGNVQNVGEWFDIDLLNMPTLEAELVQTGDGADFSSGTTFSANATLIMAFN